MKRLLLVSEKRDQSNRICAALYHYGIIDDETLIDAVYIMPMSWWHFKIPSHIAMADIPYSRTPGTDDLVLNPRTVNLKDVDPENPMSWLSRFDARFVHDGQTISKHGYFGYESARLDFTPDIDRQREPLKAIAERIDSYDQIIFAPDCDHSGWNSAFRWIGKLDEQLEALGTPSLLNTSRNIRALWLDEGMHFPFIYQCYNANIPLSDSRIQDARQQGDAKRIFDYWWFYNSAAVFSKVQRHVGMRSTKIISKYELLTLHLIAKWKEPILESSLIGGMEYWLGTGKYHAGSPHLRRKAQKEDGFYNQCWNDSDDPISEPASSCMYQEGIGTPMSRGQIINNLCDMGLLIETRKQGDPRPNNYLRLTEQGHDFLAYCHKSTFDPDLPFRLAIWCANGDYDKMARYIRTVFGKQKRYLSKLSSASEAI